MSDHAGRELLPGRRRPHTGRSGPRERVEPETWRDAREWAGHTQTQAAEAVGVSLRCWQRWEGGDRRGPWHALRAYVAVVEEPRSNVAVMGTDALPTDDSDLTRFD